MNIIVTEEMEQWIEAKIASGRYQSESDVVRDAIRHLWEKEGHIDNIMPQPSIKQPDPFTTENKAYIAMHSTLVKNHLGQYVAIYGEFLIDHDVDIGSLAKRVREKYGNGQVLIRKVEREPERILHFRSFSREKSRKIVLPICSATKTSMGGSAKNTGFCSDKVQYQNL